MAGPGSRVPAPRDGTALDADPESGAERSGGPVLGTSAGATISNSHDGGRRPGSPRPVAGSSVSGKEIRRTDIGGTVPGDDGPLPNRRCQARDLGPARQTDRPRRGV